MTILTNGFVELSNTDAASTHPNGRGNGTLNGHSGSHPPPGRDVDFLRRCAWEIGERDAAAGFAPLTSHAALAVVNPHQGFAHWRILPAWVDHTAWSKGEAWRNCRLVLRLYDVSCIYFDGFNAHQIRDLDLPGLSGQLFFKLSRTGTWQLGEVGFLLRNGEFVPAARSRAVSFPPESTSTRGSHKALLVQAGKPVEPIDNVWEQERILRERRQPRLRRPLRTAAFAFASLGSGQEGWLATFVSELAAGQRSHGHEAHVFVPATDHFRAYRDVQGVHYHPLEVRLDGTPLEQARAFRQAAANRLSEFPAFDLIHLHEWMTGIGIGDSHGESHLPAIRSLSSLESTRRGDTPADDLSREIAAAEREAVRSADCVLTPPWLRTRAAAELGLEEARLCSFPMEGRLANEWEMPLDFGHVKTSVGIGPLDRMLLYVGPLEHAAGVDVLLEAMPVLLRRAPNLRLAYVGYGGMFAHLQQRAHQLGVAYAVRLVGHLEGPPLTRLLRAAEALVLPSRYRVPFDDAVVDLARRASRPVVTTHAGPAHLVRHEENGIITYDNPGSMVWAMDRILGDAAHAQRMGRNGMRHEDSVVRWSDVAHAYLELCAARFPQLTETTW